MADQRMARPTRGRCVAPPLLPPRNRDKGRRAPPTRPLSPRPSPLPTAGVSPHLQIRPSSAREEISGDPTLSLHHGFSKGLPPVLHPALRWRFGRDAESSRPLWPTHPEMSLVSYFRFPSMRDLSFDLSLPLYVLMITTRRRASLQSVRACVCVC